MTSSQVDDIWLNAIPEAPVYRPTFAEFGDPLQYLQTISAEASRSGICKIIPPVLPLLSAAHALRVEGARFDTRVQQVRVSAWQDFSAARFRQSGRTYSLTEYEQLANAFHRQVYGFASGTLPTRQVERDYWRHMYALGDQPLTVEYGNDVEGTAFCSPESGDPLAQTAWNLQVLPQQDKSVLRLLQEDVQGVTSPMLYVGMLFASFCWHVEDHSLYSINYQHFGAAKTWYGVPGSHVAAFEKVVKERIYARAMAQARARGMSEQQAEATAHIALLEKTTSFAPGVLLNADVPVVRAVQHPGEFIVTWPDAFHAGFSGGFNVGEAVNFAMDDWFARGLASCERYAAWHHVPILPCEHLLCLAALHSQGAGDEPGPAVVALAGLLQRQRDLVKQLEGRGLQKLRGVVHARSDPCCMCHALCFTATVLQVGGQSPKRAKSAGASNLAVAEEMLHVILPPPLPSTDAGKRGDANHGHFCLAAKQLTNRDTRQGHILLPLRFVQCNLAFLMLYRSYELVMRDCSDRSWQFVVKSNPNRGSSRVYCLQRVGEYLRTSQLSAGDVVGICTDNDGRLTIQANTPEVQQALLEPTYGAAVGGECGTHCRRHLGCTKAMGHRGGCLILKQHVLENGGRWEEGWRVELKKRTDGSTVDPYYISPGGKRFRSRAEVTRFLQSAPKPDPELAPAARLMGAADGAKHAAVDQGGQATLISPHGVHGNSTPRAAASTGSTEGSTWCSTQ
ncbi:hypothetical protein WJX72_000349 [[Myrmecia] bisecta]|uniref:Uncharacterized protein n=1 Tax=[Myrmecia] bisecta TaxID=41462 RepID=A0AAW1Q9B0_9CHLO